MDCWTHSAGGGFTIVINSRMFSCRDASVQGQSSSRSRRSSPILAFGLVSWPGMEFHSSLIFWPTSFNLARGSDSDSSRNRNVVSCRPRLVWTIQASNPPRPRSVTRNLACSWLERCAFLLAHSTQPALSTPPRSQMAYSSRRPVKHLLRRPKRVLLSLRDT